MMSQPKQTIKQISGLQAIAEQYDALLCDVWGVVHNGIAIYEGVAECLQQWRAQRGPVLLLTNAPRPAQAVQARLDRLGMPPNTYDAILSSGDATYEMLKQRAAQGQVCHFAGAMQKDEMLLQGIDLQFAPVEQADFVLLTGLMDDRAETPADYQQAIDKWRQRGLPVICANPDRVVELGGQILYCAGAIAEIYEQQGGEVIWVGKPYPPIYQTALGRLADLSGLDKPRVLAAGDGYTTDILGANKAGLDVIFVTGGLAASELGRTPTAQTIAQFLQSHNAHATYFTQSLIWS